MDFGAREILIVLGILVILAILLDGVRRVNRARHGQLRSAGRRPSKNAIFDDDDDYPAELPSRGARVVEVRDEESAEKLSEKIRRESEYVRGKLTDTFARSRGEQPQPRAPDHDPAIFDETPARAEPRIPEPEPAPAPTPVTAAGDDRFADEPDRIEPEIGLDGGRGESRRPNPRGGVSEQDIVILHLMAHKGQFFEGERLLEQLLEHGLRYGSMKIFHRHEHKDGSGPVHFSVANSVNPGVFDLNLMDQFSTPGVTFIMPLDGLDKPLESFETLITTAASMARKLDGELKDETRSALTKQTIEHYRQRIIDFTRRSFTLTN
ncbi:MAG: cell division protein ZipA [Porticoccaceae bacterium]